mmetsp:Transcript_27302/g.67752  ORF Transcript_27302/g.67752 Transcript_27302/m.67752 type:complete len:253 (-) Transcript_27302:798-1556(-)
MERVANVVAHHESAGVVWHEAHADVPRRQHCDRFSVSVQAGRGRNGASGGGHRVRLEQTGVCTDRLPKVIHVWLRRVGFQHKPNDDRSFHLKRCDREVTRVRQRRHLADLTYRRGVGAHPKSVGAVRRRPQRHRLAVELHVGMRRAGLSQVPHLHRSFVRASEGEVGLDRREHAAAGRAQAAEHRPRERREVQLPDAEHPTAIQTADLGGVPLPRRLDRLRRGGVRHEDSCRVRSKAQRRRLSRAERRREID